MLDGNESFILKSNTIRKCEILRKRQDDIQDLINPLIWQITDWKSFYEKKEGNGVHEFGENPRNPCLIIFLCSKMTEN